MSGAEGRNYRCIAAAGLAFGTNLVRPGETGKDIGWSVGLVAQSEQPLRDGKLAVALNVGALELCPNAD
jgi:hypothetical protein